MRSSKRASSTSRRSARSSKRWDLSRFRALLDSRRPRITPRLIDRANELALAKLRSDPQGSLALAEMAMAMAARISSSASLASSLRAKGNALHMLGDNRASLDSHLQALSIFRQLGSTLEVARTENASIQPLILLGEYQQALRAATKARRLFRRLGDRRRSAFVEINLGNIYHRQDRFEQALSCYRRAYRIFAPLQDFEGAAVAFNNMSSCLVGLNDFPRALKVNEQARRLSVRRGLPLLASHADYNKAYLYYLRGEYTPAIELLRAVREKAGKSGDAHILALSFLVLSDIYLDLNLGTEAAHAAQDAAAKFRELGMNYELAKSLANEAIVLGQSGKANEALGLFAHARSVFVQEGNLAWPSLIDLYRAIVLSHKGQINDAAALAAEAMPLLEGCGQIDKSVLCRLLLARLELARNHPNRALEVVALALAKLVNLQLPSLHFQAHFLLGQALLRMQHAAAAFQSFESARRDLENLRVSLQKDDLKIALLKNKGEVYEELVALCRQQAHPEATPEKMFELIESAKSRGLMELILESERAGAQPAGKLGKKSRKKSPKESPARSRLRDLRDRIHWYYRRIELEQMRAAPGAQSQIQQWRAEVAQLEDRFLRDFRDRANSPGQHQAPGHLQVASLRQVQSALAPAVSLVEYFVAGEQVLVSVIDRQNVRTVELGSLAAIRRTIQGLHHQLSKFKLAPEYLQEFADVLRESVEGHLLELYGQLLAPVRSSLADASRLVFIPHGILHSIPFHALFDGDSYIIDRFTISYAPSATIYAHHLKPSTIKHSSYLILGIPDEAAPLILDEVRAVAKILPRSELYVGEKATERVLREKSYHRKVVHIATHGNFRQDNPAFSTIKLGSSYINLCDLYDFRFSADLVTLSGCGTGLNLISAGDEQVGLMRGFLGAGARSLLLTLWDVNDRSTAHFMTNFYQALRDGRSKAEAFQVATRATRQLSPHPYYWAPFILVGNPA
jgi:CHAT domain-containing protein